MADAELTGVCAHPDITIDTSQLHPGGQVTATVGCTVPLGDLLLLKLPGTDTVDATSSSVVDTYVQKRRPMTAGVPTPERFASRAAARRDESGSVLVFVVGVFLALIVTAGLVFDGGTILAAHREADAEAEGAARAAAQQMSATPCTPGRSASTQSLAQQAVDRYLAPYHHAASWP